MPAALEIRRLQHIGIPVTDIARSRQFYERLGFRDGMSTTFAYDGAVGHVCMMQQHEITLELYQLPGAAAEEVRLRRNGHVDHFAFDVADIEATFRTLKDAGYDIVEEAPVTLPFWKNGCRYFNILGPDGERIEFNQIL